MHEHVNKQRENNNFPLVQHVTEWKNAKVNIYIYTFSTASGSERLEVASLSEYILGQSQRPSVLW